MTNDDFDFLCKLLKEGSGLVVTNDKAYLVESRLLPVARKHGHKSLDELVGALRLRPSGVMAREVIEAMTTNESFFFRDTKPFDLFKSFVLPSLAKARVAKKHFRILSAACSSGQEPYTLAMLLNEERAKFAGWKFDIVATDLSAEILDRAKAGFYSQFEVQRGLPITYLVKYFRQQGDKWLIDPAIRGMVQFRQFNLLDDLRTLGSFDVVFCRNVLIYFDQPTKARIVNQIARMLPADGFMFLGGAETVIGITDKFQIVPDIRGIYMPAVAAPAAPKMAARA